MQPLVWYMYIQAENTIIKRTLESSKPREMMPLKDTLLQRGDRHSGCHQTGRVGSTPRTVARPG